MLNRDCFYKTRANCWWCCCILTLQASPRLWPLLHWSTLWYINMPVYVSYAHLLRKGVRNNSLVLFTRMCNSWMTIKNRWKLWKLIIAILGYQWIPWLIMEVDSWNGTMTIKSWKHHGVCITIIKVKIHTNANKEKFWMSCEHRGVR